MNRLISEQAVIEAIEFFQMNPQHFDFINLIDDIKEIPSAEPKTGHWIYIGNSEVNGLKIVKCSSCRRRTYGSGKYCPNCGAKMVESEDQ